MSKWSFWVLVVTLPVFLLSFTIIDRSMTYAVSGCCKERSSYKGTWRQSGKSLKECRKANKRKDNDNLFDRSGKVWWDANCD